MKLFVVMALLVVAATPASAQDARPSFDCARAQSQPEKLICSDEGLARLDHDLSDAYQAALKAGMVDKASQVAWIRSRDEPCVTVDAKECLRKKMEHRIDELYRREVREPATSYVDRVKSTLLHLLQGRDFEPSVGCRSNVPKEDPQLCASLMAKLRAGDFDVLVPDERSTKPDMPSYRRARKKCRKLDFVHIETHAGAMTTPALATRNFGIYKLDIANDRSHGDEVLVFRAQHYVMGIGDEVVRDDNGDPIPAWPGRFVAFALPSCRTLSIAIADEGDWGNAGVDVRPGEWLSELLKIGQEYFVINIVPIAGSKEERSQWYYNLELWNWGAHADADARHQRHLYAFVYKPAATPH
jgi:uncharacterized protein YecT (DUF1311 family)